MTNFLIWTIVMLVVVTYTVNGLGFTRSGSGCTSSAVWRCKNGGCVDFDRRCDGRQDCSDGSDETIRECISFECDEDKFRCAYGACVSKTSECNGVMDCADNSDELTEKCLPDIDETIRGKCSPNEFQCKTGECISIRNLCDGTKDCQDSSDETIEYCASKCCPPFAFRCGYGACIDEKLRCDGTATCLDGSDENYLLCGYPENFEIQPNDHISYPGNQHEMNGACHITKVPRNGWIENPFDNKESLSPGDFVNSYTTIIYKCFKNHIIVGATANTCIQGAWRKPVPECQPRCRAEAIFGASIFASGCFLDGKDVECNEPAKLGTTAHIKCRDHYEWKSTSKEQIITCGDDGVWLPMPDICSPICGEEAPDITPYVIGGYRAKINEAPWHAAIYKYSGTSYAFTCGATIINARVLLSAMHCFWDVREAKPFDVSIFRVGVGKEMLSFDAIERQKEQKFGIEKIFHDPGYSHATGNFAADIVLIVLNAPIEFRSYIGPVCIPYGLTFGDQVVPSGWIGRVAGWGKTSTVGPASEFLKIVELPTIDRNECIAKTSDDFHSQITPDKFCAGYLNQNVSVCQGDSGGGLVFKSTENHKDKWYLRGIVSTGANKQGNCDSDKYSTFTNVAYYEKLISTYEPQYRPR